MWSIALKLHAGGKLILDVATDIAVCNFNDGLTSLMQIMQVLNLTVGHNCFHFCAETDAHRINDAERSLTDAAKEARKGLKTTRKAVDEANDDLEEQFYGAGNAD